MSADELIPSLLLGIGNLHFNGDDFTKALSSYDKILSKFPQGDAGPESIFQKGVILYKSTDDPKPLKEAYMKLQDKYPESQWTKRSCPYRLIE